MNVFSTLKRPGEAIPLTQARYNSETHRTKPYVWTEGEDVKSYALCPACANPILLVNRNVPSTNAQILYAKHAGRTVPGLAVHDQSAYEDCPFHNPERFDSKALRTNVACNEEIRNALINHIHLVVKILEKATGIDYSDALIEAMLNDFGGNKGYRYKAISIYNLPFGFAYMTEAQDMYGLKVSSSIAECIMRQSNGFEIGPYERVVRKQGKKGTRIRFYFNNHRLGDPSLASDSVDLVVAEINSASRQSSVLYKKTLEFDSALFFKTYMRRERLRLLALKHL